MRRLLTLAVLVSAVSVVHAASPTFRASVDNCRRIVQREAPGELRDAYYYADAEGTGNASAFGTARGHFLFEKCMREQGEFVEESR